MLKKLVCTLLYFTIICVTAQKKTFTVIIDAGHGGRDSGARGKHDTQEKEITLSIALLLGKEIDKNFKNVKIIYTRKTDVFVPLIERARIANQNKGQLFISIHCNSAPNNDAAHGAETYVLGMNRTKSNFDVAKRENAVILLEKNYKQNYKGFNPNAPESIIGLTLFQNNYLDKSIQFANQVQKHFSKLNRFDRGVKQAGFLVIREVAMPAALIEVGFLSSSNEALYLKTKQGQNQIAKSIFEAFASFKKDYDKREGANNVIRKGNHSKKEHLKTEIKKPVFEKIVSSVSASRIEQEDKTNHLKIDNLAKDTTIKIERQDSIETVVKAFTKNKNFKNNRTTKAITQSGISYRVQIGISKNKLNKNHSIFKNFPKAIFYLENNTYKYTIGNSFILSEMLILQQRAKKLGFKDAFIVAFKDNKRIRLPNIH